MRREQAHAWRQIPLSRVERQLYFLSNSTT
jgi:hypothetical protein